MNWDIFNPSVITRLWTLDVGSYSGGWSYCFWLKRSALKKAQELMDRYLFVSIKNELTGRVIRLKPLKPYPPSVVDMETGLIIEGVDKGQYI